MTALQRFSALKRACRHAFNTSDLSFTLPATPRQEIIQSIPLSLFTSLEIPFRFGLPFSLSPPETIRKFVFFFLVRALQGEATTEGERK